MLLIFIVEIILFRQIFESNVYINIRALIAEQQDVKYALHPKLC